VQAVQVEAVEAYAPRCVLVPLAKPLDELEHDGVTPHPGREAAEAGERIVGGAVVPGAADVAVHAVGIRPVGLGGDRVEAVLVEQALRQLRAQRVELVCSVRPLAEQDEARAGGPFEQRLDSVFDCEGSHAGGASWSSSRTSSSVVCPKSSYQRPTA